MGASYVPISWNPFKKKYDWFLGVFISLYLLVFFGINLILFPQLLIVTLIIRAFGTLAILLLHFILIIGPLCRLNSNFLPLLYNRRHLGVTMFLVASVHAILSLIWFHTGGYVHPLISLFGGNTHYDSLRFFPFQTLGFSAYIILMIMAFTSHDFWLNFLSPKVWKGLHMLVYLAYSLLIMHVVLGIIQLETDWVLFFIVLSGLITVATLHVLAGIKEWKLDHQRPISNEKDWVYVSDYEEIENNRAKMINIDQERVAIYRYDDKISAVHNVCKHQNGPLGEGKIVDGCIVCPWHGYQYLPENGRAPAPFTEKLSTYKVKLEGKAIYINIKAFPEGTSIEPAIIPQKDTPSPTPFFIGWSNKPPKAIIQLTSRFALSFGLFALVLAVLISSKTHHIAKSSFDYTNLKKVQGQLISFPFPAIRTLEGRDKKGNPIVKTYPLINDSKFGANGIVDSVQKNYDIQKYITQIQGGEIKRNGVASLELSLGKLSVKVGQMPNELPKSELKKRKDTILMGEIIDPKCYLGAMNPGEGKPHRACAILCIGGGIMPMMAFKGKDQKIQYAVLLGSKGERINKEVIPFIAEPVKIQGTLYQFDNWLVFYTNPKTEIIPFFN